MQNLSQCSSSKQCADQGPGGKWLAVLHQLDRTLNCGVILDVYAHHVPVSDKLKWPMLLLMPELRIDSLPRD